MATLLLVANTVGVDLDAKCTALEAEINTTTATVEGAYETDGLTNPGTSRSSNVVHIVATGATDAGLATDVATVGGLVALTHALASEDAE